MHASAAVVANWNGSGLLRTALRSLRSQEHELKMIVVVDNGSTDDSRRIVREDFSDVALIENSRNLGFAAANNQGIASALTNPEIEHVFLMNNDMWAEPQVVGILATTLLADQRVGAVQAKTRFHNLPWRINSAGDFVDADDLRVVNRGYGEPDTGQYDDLTEIFSPCAGAALYRRAFLEDTALANGAFFDPAYFAYLEDVDLACRGHLRGWRFLYEPRAIVYHHESATSRRLPAATKEYLSRRNRLWTAVKTLPPGLCAKVLLRYALPSRRGISFVLRDARAPSLTADVRATTRALLDTVRALPVLLRARKRLRARATAPPEALAAWFRPPRALHR